MNDSGESILSIVTGLAHEVGNPLCAITNYAYTLEGKVSPELRPTVQALQREVARIQRMIDGLAESARPREAAAQGADVNVALAETLRFLGDQGVLGRVSLEQDLEDAPLHVRGTTLELEQVFANLILNAIDAMPAGGRLAISTGRPAQAVKIVVADSGRGVAPGSEERIFEPYVTTKENGRGTGLGLWIVRRLVHAMGGRVWVERPADGGAAFHVELPVHGPERTAPR